MDYIKNLMSQDQNTRQLAYDYLVDSKKIEHTFLVLAVNAYECSQYFANDYSYFKNIYHRPEFSLARDFLNNLKDRRYNYTLKSGPVKKNDYIKHNGTTIGGSGYNFDSDLLSFDHTKNYTNFSPYLRGFQHINDSTIEIIEDDE